MTSIYRLLIDTQSLEQLADKLNQFESIRRFDSGGETEAGRLAHSLSHLEESFIEILQNHLPVLLRIDDEESMNQALLDIGEELRHILYHIKDPKFFRYLFEEE